MGIEVKVAIITWAVAGCLWLGMACVCFWLVTDEDEPMIHDDVKCGEVKRENG